MLKWVSSSLPRSLEDRADLVFRYLASQYAKALLAHAHSPTENPSGFQISRSSRPVSVSYANEASFLPQPGGGQDCISGSTKGIGGLNGSVKYWDTGASVIELYAQGWEAAEAGAFSRRLFERVFPSFSAHTDLASFLRQRTTSLPPSSRLSHPWSRLWTQTPLRPQTRLLRNPSILSLKNPSSQSPSRHPKLLRSVRPVVLVLWNAARLTRDFLLQP